MCNCHGLAEYILSLLAINLDLDEQKRSRLPYYIEDEMTLMGRLGTLKPQASINSCKLAHKKHVKSPLKASLLLLLSLSLLPQSGVIVRIVYALQGKYSSPSGRRALSV